MNPAEATSNLDRLMDQASNALVQTEYFAAEKLCVRALRQAHKAGDFERLARICLPLQEARRQRRMLALDSGLRLTLSTNPDPKSLLPGFYLVQPPLIGLDARNLRESLFAAGTPALVLAREPMTRAGLWPVVAVGSGGLTDTLTLRVRLAPPAGVTPRETGITRDHAEEPPSAEWFIAASEALGDAAIAQIPPDLHPAWRVDDLIRALDAHPDHEKLHQRLAEACRAAAAAPPPVGTRRRAIHDHPYSF